MGSQPLADHRDRLESGLAARRFVTRLSGAGDTEDQVPRKLTYEETHDGEFAPPCRHDAKWRWIAVDGFELAAIDLGELLDKLDGLEARDTRDCP